MDNFRDKLAVITGGGTGMGRALARQLSAEGCHVAMCDVLSENMAESKRLCDAGAPAGTRVTTHAKHLHVAFPYRLALKDFVHGLCPHVLAFEAVEVTNRLL